MKITHDDIAAMTLAHAVIASAEIRENSYDSVAAKAAFDNGITMQDFYGLTLREACEKGCPEHLVEPVHLMLYSFWNDALKWANELATRMHNRMELLKVAKTL
jgi:hypothetical protein